jgi:hypothetical protein
MSVAAPARSRISFFDGPFKAAVLSFRVRYKKCAARSPRGTDRGDAKDASSVRFWVRALQNGQAPRRDRGAVNFSANVVIAGASIFSGRGNSSTIE